jgi:hypothetical protein
MSTAAQRVAEGVRRNAVLAILAFAPGQAATARAIRDQLEANHGQTVTVDRVRADLLWLADVGSIERLDDLVRLTEAGRDVVLGRAQLPGA